MTISLEYESLSLNELNQLAETITIYQNKRKDDFWSIVKRKNLQELEHFISQYPDDFSLISYEEFNIDFFPYDIAFIQKINSLLINHADKDKFYHRFFKNGNHLTERGTITWVDPNPSSYGLFYKGLTNKKSFISIADNFSTNFLLFFQKQIHDKRINLPLDFLLCLEQYYSKDDYHNFIKAELNKCCDMSIWNYFKEKKEYHHLFNNEAKVLFLTSHILQNNPQAYLPDYAKDPFFEKLFDANERYVTSLYSASWQKENIPSFLYFLDNYDLNPRLTKDHDMWINSFCDTFNSIFSILLPRINNHKKILAQFINSFYRSYEYENKVTQVNFMFYMGYISNKPLLIEEFNKQIKNYSHNKKKFYENCQQLLFKYNLEHNLPESSSKPKVKL